MPGDATVVAVLGPSNAFTPDESAAMVRYFERKGRVLLALDPENVDENRMLLEPMGLAYEEGILAHPSAYRKVASQPSDKGNIITNKFASHASVKTLVKVGRRYPLVFQRAGGLSKSDKSTRGIVNVRLTVKALDDTWNDKNGNYALDRDIQESRRIRHVVAAVTKRTPVAITVEDEARAVVVADSDVFSDSLLSLGSNRYLAIDSFNWLAGEERVTGFIRSERDVPILHTRKQDTLWFYATILGGPLLVLGVGVFMNRKTRLARPERRKAAVLGPDRNPSANATSPQVRDQNQEEKPVNSEVEK